MRCLTTSALAGAALRDWDLEAGVMSETALAAEVTYDSGLVCLAVHCGIDVTPDDFAHPKIARVRLEFELLNRGVVLESQAGRRSSASEPR